MKITIYGPGCPKCRALEKNVRKAVEELGIEAEIEHVYDPLKMVEDNVFASPGLGINGKVVSTGKVLSIDEIKQLLK